MSSSLTATKPPKRIVHLQVRNGHSPLVRFSTFPSGMLFPLFIRLRDRHALFADWLIAFRTALCSLQPRNTKLFRAHHALRPCEHYQNQQCRIDDEAVAVEIAG